MRRAEIGERDTACRGVEGAVGASVLPALRQGQGLSDASRRQRFKADER